MFWFEYVLFSLVGIVGIVYSFKTKVDEKPLIQYLPKPFNERKIAFITGFAITILSLALGFFVSPHHELLALFGTGFMLTGSQPWFGRRILRETFSHIEWKIIRLTLFSGLIIACLVVLQALIMGIFSPGTLLMSIAIMIMSGRLWWHQNPMLENKNLTR